MAFSKYPVCGLGLGTDDNVAAPDNVRYARLSTFGLCGVRCCGKAQGRSRTSLWNHGVRSTCCSLYSSILTPVASHCWKNQLFKHSKRPVFATPPESLCQSLDYVQMECDVHPDSEEAFDEDTLIPPKLIASQCDSLAPPENQLVYAPIFDLVF